MKIHKIVLVPGAGHSDAEGRYTRGHDTGKLAEVGVVDLYLSHIADVLDGEGVRHEILGTRKAPGIRASERHLGIMANSLIVDCRAGWYKPNGRTYDTNVTKVYYGDLSAYPIARDLAEVIGHWGQLYAHGHRTSKPAEDLEDRTLSPAGSVGVRLEPFQLNGPMALDYARHLAVLGKDIGRLLANYCRSRGSAIGARPSSLTY